MQKEFRLEYYKSWEVLGAPNDYSAQLVNKSL